LIISSAALGAHHESVEDEIRGLLNKFNTAYATNDADTYFGLYAEDASVFFYGERQDLATYGEYWRATIAAGGGALKNEISDVRIQVMPGDNVAIVTYFVDNESKTTQGEVTSARAFETDVWRRMDGEWKIVSLHYTEF
jgi:uncharacterized protein (TIGR02246 family)